MTDIHIHNYMPVVQPRQDVGLNGTSNSPQSSPQMDAGLQGLPSPGALNFDTKLGATHSGAIDMDSIMGASQSKEVNFLEDPNYANNMATEARNAQINNANNSVNNLNNENPIDAQIQQLLSMLQNMIAILASMFSQGQAEEDPYASESGGIDYNGDNASGAQTPANDSSNQASSPSRSSQGAGKSEGGGKSEGAGKSERRDSEKVNGDSENNTTTTGSAAGTEKAGGPSTISGPAMPQADFEQHFETEGNSPYQADGSQVFDAFSSDVRTENGNGIRNENKIKEEDRVAMSESNESFSATITPDVSPGSQAIISQWHGAEEGALVKLYLDDQGPNAQPSGTENGVAGDGIFDVYTRYTDSSGEEQFISHGTIKEGESLDVAFDKQGNDFSANVNGTSADFTVIDDPEVYFKYGMYLQTKDPETGDKAKPNDGGMDILADNNITQAAATFENANFTREVV